MKAELKSLFDKKGKIVNEMKDAYRLVSERSTQENPGVATKEERAKFDAWDKELVQIQDQIDLAQRMEKLETIEAGQKGIVIESTENKEKKYNDNATQSERRAASEKAKKSGYSSLNEEERIALDTDMRDVASFERFLRGGFANLSEQDKAILKRYKEVPKNGQEQRVQSTTPAAGGYTIPQGFAGRIVEYMKFISQLTNWANIMRTDSGNTIPFPINNDTTNTGELIGENADISSSSADLVFTTYNLGAYKFSSKMIKVSNELLQDTGVDLTGYLAKKLAERVARITNTYYTTGTGSSQPRGYLAASGGASRGTVTASTTTFTSAELIAFQDSLDIAYANNPKVAFAMHQNFMSEIKQLTIGSNYNLNLWLPSFRDGEPDRLLGKPYFINQAMSSTSATGDIVIAYGDWDKFNIRVVNDFTLRRLDERYAEFDQVAFFGLMRTDSFLEDTTAIKYMDIS